MLLSREAFGAQAQARIFITSQDKQIPAEEKPEDQKGRTDSQQENKNWRSKQKWDGFWPSEIEEETVEAIDSSIEEIQEKQNNTW